MAVNVVWFKRDLRITDHWPLVEAAARGRAFACTSMSLSSQKFRIRRISPRFHQRIASKPLR